MIGPGAFDTDRVADGGKCLGCTATFTGDLLVPDDLWQRIRPLPHGNGGHLCPTCIVARAAALGIAYLIVTG